MEPRRPGIARDIQQIREGTSATAVELREFLDQMKGRSPQEVLGMIAQSSLIQSTVVATLGTVVLFAAGSIGPWAWGKAFGKPATQAAAVPAQPGQSATTAAQPATTTTQSVATNTADATPTDPTVSTDKPKKKGSDDVLEKLGVGEATTAEPTDKDDLLKDIK